MYIFYSKYYLLLLFSISFFQLSAHDKGKSEKKENCDNYVLVQGSSNINKFEFINNNPSISKDKRDPKNLFAQNIRIPVRDFSGPNKLMLNDFYKMLNADQYPYIKIEIEPYNSTNFDEESAGTLLDTKITIAGKTHDYLIPCELTFCENSGAILKGGLELQLSAFDIDPPSKILGTVKVNNDVFITFSFRYL